MMKTAYIELDTNLWLEVEYVVDGYDEGTDYAPPSNASIVIARAFLSTSTASIPVTELNSPFMDIDWDKVEQEIEEQLRND